MERIRFFFKVLKTSFLAFLSDRGMKLSAALSYYTVFSLGPLLLIIISLAAIFFGKEAVQGKIYGQIQGLVGKEAALQIQEIIRSISQHQNTSMGAVIGTVILFVGASGVFTEMQDSLNFIWSVKAKPQRGWLKFLTNRLVSFSLIVGLGFIFLVSLVINALMDILSEHLSRFFPRSMVYLLYSLNLILVFVVITALFAIIFKVLPDAVIRWKDALIGAGFTAILFMGGKFLIGYYLGNSNVGLTYGAAASLVIVFLWVYYSSIILYFGAEFTKIYAIQAGAGIRPKQTAVFIIKKEEKEIPENFLST